MSSQAILPRSQGVDLLRGILILLVIVGHVVLGTVDSSWLRYAIYSFHMPLFIGLTGYLINANSLKQSSFVSVFKRYWWRVLFPFGFAFVFFTGILLIHAYQEGRVSSGLLLSYFHTPYYHLWFIPTLVVWVFAFRVSLFLPALSVLILLITLAVSLYWAVTPTSELSWRFDGLLGVLMEGLLSKKVVYFFSFFLLGAWLRNSKIKIASILPLRWVSLVVIALSFIFYMSAYASYSSMHGGISWFVLNVLLIVLLVPWSKSAEIHCSNTLTEVLVSMGRNSLPIYLWHVVPLFLIKGFGLHLIYPVTYYVISVLVILGIVFSVLRNEDKKGIVQKVIYGN